MPEKRKTVSEVVEEPEAKKSYSVAEQKRRAKEWADAQKAAKAAGEAAVKSPSVGGSKRVASSPAPKSEKRTKRGKKQDPPTPLLTDSEEEEEEEEIEVNLAIDKIIIPTGGKVAKLPFQGGRRKQVTKMSPSQEHENGYFEERLLASITEEKRRAQELRNKELSSKRIIKSPLPTPYYPPASDLSTPTEPERKQKNLISHSRPSLISSEKSADSVVVSAWNLLCSLKHQYQFSFRVLIESFMTVGFIVCVVSFVFYPDKFSFARGDLDDRDNRLFRVYPLDFIVSLFIIYVIGFSIFLFAIVPFMMVCDNVIHVGGLKGLQAALFATILLIATVGTIINTLKHGTVW